MRELTWFPLLQSYPKTSNYGYRYDPITGAPGSFHRGVDYGAPTGAPVIAPFDGEVTTGYEAGGAGNWLWVVAGGDTFKSFHHVNFEVWSGWAEAGQTVAYIGSTGASTGSHAHLELWDHGVNIDPTGYLDRAPLYGPPPPPEDDMTEDDHHRIIANVGALLDNRIAQLLTVNLLWHDGDNWYEVLTADGRRVRRRLQAGELLALRTGAVAAEQPVVEVQTIDPGAAAAFRAWPEVTHD